MSYKLAFGLVSFLAAFLLFTSITFYDVLLDQNERIFLLKELICYYQQEKIGLQNCAIPGNERILEILN